MRYRRCPGLPTSSRDRVEQPPTLFYQTKKAHYFQYFSTRKQRRNPETDDDRLLVTLLYGTLIALRDNVIS